MKERPLQVDWTRSASRQLQLLPELRTQHRTGTREPLRYANRTLSVVALVSKQRQLTLSVVAVGEGRGDQRALQGATHTELSHHILTQSVLRRRFWFALNFHQGNNSAYQMYFLKVLPPSGRFLHKPVCNLTLKIWNLDAIKTKK